MFKHVAVKLTSSQESDLSPFLDDDSISIEDESISQVDLLNYSRLLKGKNIDYRDHIESGQKVSDIYLVLLLWQGPLWFVNNFPAIKEKHSTFQRDLENLRWSNENSFEHNLINRMSIILDVLTSESFISNLKAIAFLKNEYFNYEILEDIDSNENFNYLKDYTLFQELEEFFIYLYDFMVEVNTLATQGKLNSEPINLILHKLDAYFPISDKFSSILPNDLIIEFESKLSGFFDFFLDQFNQISEFNNIDSIAINEIIFKLNTLSLKAIFKINFTHESDLTYNYLLQISNFLKSDETINYDFNNLLSINQNLESNVEFFNNYECLTNLINTMRSVCEYLNQLNKDKDTFDINISIKYHQKLNDYPLDFENFKMILSDYSINQLKRKILEILLSSESFLIEQNIDVSYITSDGFTASAISSNDSFLDSNGFSVDDNNGNISQTQFGQGDLKQGIEESKNSDTFNAFYSSNLSENLRKTSDVDRVIDSDNNPARNSTQSLDGLPNLYQGSSSNNNPEDLLILNFNDSNASSGSDFQIQFRQDYLYQADEESKNSDTFNDNKYSNSYDLLGLSDFLQGLNNSDNLNQGSSSNNNPENLRKTSYVDRVIDSDNNPARNSIQPLNGLYNLHQAVEESSCFITQSGAVSPINRNRSVSEVHSSDDETSQQTSFNYDLNFLNNSQISNFSSDGNEQNDSLVHNIDEDLQTTTTVTMTTIMDEKLKISNLIKNDLTKIEAIQKALNNLGPTKDLGGVAQTGGHLKVAGLNELLENINYFMFQLSQLPPKIDIPQNLDKDVLIKKYNKIYDDAFIKITEFNKEFKRLCNLLKTSIKNYQLIQNPQSNFSYQSLNDLYRFFNDLVNQYLLIQDIQDLKKSLDNFDENITPLFNKLFDNNFKIIRSMYLNLNNEICYSNEYIPYNEKYLSFLPKSLLYKLLKSLRDNFVSKIIEISINDIEIKLKNLIKNENKSLFFADFFKELNFQTDNTIEFFHRFINESDIKKSKNFANKKETLNILKEVLLQKLNTFKLIDPIDLLNNSIGYIESKLETLLENSKKSPHLYSYPFLSYNFNLILSEINSLSVYQQSLSSAINIDKQVQTLVILKDIVDELLNSLKSLDQDYKSLFDSLDKPNSQKTF